ncbi:hypothetical protein BN1723_013103 [Verticillium longisporum]|uniref:Fungal N-terminal domain-containing protein n=1 Tax=Verticillium longisporum TaxID=100787 RepID=A0A0G4N289_VERLO|nr:hypothetical protein BN1723_013103 [Verticillium longisporum]CRK40562.1 hypothetical protein BN1708_008278 [Verticillium longisporum]
MAEAFAILGVVGVGLQIAKEFIRLSDSFSALSHASEDCQYFALSSKNMSAVITSLFTAARRSLEVIETDQRPEREATLDGLIKEFGQVQLRLRDLAIDTRIDEQHLGSNDSYFVRLTFSWRWYRKKAAVTMSRMMQETTKSTANLFISTMLCEDLMRQIRVLQETKTDSKDLQSLNNQVKFLSEQIVNQRRDVRFATKQIESFRKAHPEVIQPDEIASLRDVEKAVVASTLKIVPSTKRRGQAARQPRNEHGAAPRKLYSYNEHLNSRQNLVPPPPRRRRADSGPQPPPPRTAPRHARSSEIHRRPSSPLPRTTARTPIITTTDFSTPTVRYVNIPESPVSDRFTGTRVRGEGQNSHEKVGDLPQEVFTEPGDGRDADSRRATPIREDKIASTAEGSVKKKKKTKKSLEFQSPSRNGSPQTRNVVEEEGPKLADDDPRPSPTGRMQPMPPFDEDDLRGVRRRMTERKSGEGGGKSPKS